MKRHIIALTAAIAVLTSCEKDDKKEIEKPKTKSEILMDRPWDIDYLHTKTTMGGTVIFDETDTIGGTAQFKANKVLVASIPGEGSETSTWEIVGDSLFIDDEGMYIEKLTDKQFIFSTEETGSIPDSLPLPFTVHLQFELNR